ncbi:rod shape-determining protein RodA [Salisediminibacterium halotolerans]|uniref:rod shape-determining protein RodA n=1 Tax=Salisediminibacterium halotolerans TaxID=517425 RepID=UPI000EABF6EC|nr:rod shape-determining protein RodA [Salisediminibacterium halotolerans]RLJ69419.1 rod shape-determining protein RodA [Actinophytocola xinjiangensis]RPE83955.1 rod shape-determining protein RodA [Salisediminibacterium halotolerans]TWG32494.1 rod shape-determining protein RodA [Salisediminibacterium halotolerans]GEL07665.1 cell division protein FtsW [Salisediminibacterium halotolerans]
MQERKTPFQQLDFSLLFYLFVLMCFSLIAIHSAGAAGQYEGNFVQLQIIWFAIGTILMLSAMVIDYELFKNLSLPLYIIGMVLLLLVHFFGIEVNGAQRWIDIPGLGRFQPSEFVKIFVIITLAHYVFHLAKTPREKTFKSDIFVVGKILAIGLPPFGLILIQPDLGTAMVIAVVIFIMILMSGVTYRMISLIIGLFVSFVALLVWLHNNFFAFFTQYVIQPHQLTRIYAWLDPNANIGAEGYQLFHAMQGIGSGQLYGTGFTEGVKTASGNIPELHTDFIFTVIGEEFGFVGATVLLIIYFLLLYRMIIIAFTCNNSFGTYLVAGVVGLIAFQIFQNIGMTIGLVPITGLALPFVSYGGSALITNMLAVGIVLNVNIRTKNYMFGENE